LTRKLANSFYLKPRLSLLNLEDPQLAKSSRLPRTYPNVPYSV
jgi:hypothetical protein